ncbi:uncharacterized protein LDX57_004640 [Aspergillus melleus]|uniref:uncharacterized protein n=1 Tax=Aspergillus melleus TaxID=138277 RepID=UPI001E8E287F|nr:uncharacterized protein LDX57_004640 [Aspergillus melleus]KAH8426917.1 hypothetical protein LDX57_004640 [Aspergillus melleus]
MDIVNASESENPLSDATSELARVAGLDIGVIDTQLRNDSKVTELTGIPPPDAPNLLSRDTSWRAVAETRARAALINNLGRLLQVYDAPMPVVTDLRNLGMCGQTSRSIIDSCKQGVRAQVAACKQKLKDAIAQCKDHVGRTIDACKKRYSRWDPRKLNCELQRKPLELSCEARRLNVPLCEFDRLNAACCEGTRPQAQSMCYAGFSAAEIEKQSQSVQQKCAIAVAIAKSATKSYLTGQAVGILSQLSTVREIQQGTQLVQKLQNAQKDYQSFAQGVTAVTEGRINDAQQLLGTFRSQLPSPISNAAAWGDAAQALASRKSNELLKAACGAVGDIQVLSKAVEQIERFKSVQKTLLSIQSAARECSWQTRLNPENFRGFREVKSEQQVRAAIAAYERFIAAEMREFAQCRAVFDRVTKLININF